MARSSRLQKAAEADSAFTPATAFRARARQRAMMEFDDPEPVTLPGGWKVMLRRPRPAYFAYAGLPLPQSLASRFQKGTVESEPMTPDELRIFAHRITELMQLAFVNPRLVPDIADAERGEIDPAWLDEQDYAFLTKYLVGEVLANGRNLAEFRGQPRPADPGATGRHVAMPAIDPASVVRM